MELLRTKNKATIITFPLVTAAGSVVTSASSLDSEYSYWTDSVGPVSMADCTAEAVELPSEGVYALSLTAGEMNHDYVYIQIKSPMAAVQAILMNTVYVDGEAQQSTLSTIQASIASVQTDTTSIAISANSLLANVLALKADTLSIMRDVTSIAVGVNSLVSDINIMAVETTSILANVKTGVVSIMISTQSILSNVAAVFVDTTSTNANVKLYGNSTAIAVASILTNVGLWGTSVMISTTSLLANQILWGTSSGIAIRSVASQIATMQIENTSILANVQTGFVSTMIGVASLLANQTLWGTSAGIAVRSVASQIATMQIENTSILSNVKTGFVSTMIGVVSILSNIATMDLVVDAIKVDTESLISAVSLANVYGLANWILNQGQDVALASLIVNVNSVVSVPSAIVQIPDLVWDETFEGTETARQYLRLTRAFQLGMASGGGSTTQRFFSRDGLTERVTMTTDALGDRSVVSTVAT